MEKISINELVREAEQNYLNGSTNISEYVEWDMHNTIETIDAYLNSKHISGPTDALGRDKPFFNIVTAATNIWYRATDLDRKNIRILPDNSSNVAIAFITTILLQNWMKESRFGMFLNDWGRSLARYGSSVCKFVEKDGELVATVVPWNRMIVDPIDFDALPRIEKIYMTPAQLRKMDGYDKEVVEALINSQVTRKTLDKHQVDNQAKFIEIYEVHGELPEYLLTDEEPDEEEDVVYRQQMHVISFVETKAGVYDDFCLYKGKEAKDPYMITHLIKEDGRTLSIGAVEHLFEAQWMVNHAQKNMKDTLDLASKLIFQTADHAFLGRNVLSAIETGDIMIHTLGNPLTQVNNSKPDVTAFQNFSTVWSNLAREVSSTPESLRGITPPSGVALGTVQIATSQGLSLFEIMTENKGLQLEDMLRTFILPFLKKKMDSKDEVVAFLDQNQITELDAMYVPRQAIKNYNREAKEALLKGVLPTPYQADVEQGKVKQSLAELGNKRFFKPSEIDEKTWKQALKDFAMTATVEITDENTEKQVVLQTLNTLLQTIATNPAVLQDPNAKMLFSAILTETGRISPIQLSSLSAPTAPSTGGTEALPV